MRSISSLEYTYWKAFASLEPIGVERGDWHAALVARTLAEVNRDGKSNPFPHRIRDFLLFAPPVDEADDDEALAQRLRAAFGVKEPEIKE